MLNNKVLLTIGAFLLASVSLTSAEDSECTDCRGDILKESVQELSNKSSCWFKPNNNYLLRFKYACVRGCSGVLDDLYQKTNEAASDECRQNIELPTCEESDDYYAVSQCKLQQMTATAQAYWDLEQCSGQVTDTRDVDLLLKVIVGTIVGWHVVHPEC
uniref:Uncharacterized protein n=1 Tax=Stomoxys calcitrans TaxID=35570 RepID=A0A1I8PAM6_STOCA